MKEILQGVIESRRLNLADFVEKVHKKYREFEKEGELVNLSVLIELTGIELPQDMQYLDRMANVYVNDAELRELLNDALEIGNRLILDGAQKIYIEHLKRGMLNEFKVEYEMTGIEPIREAYAALVDYLIKD